MMGHPGISKLRFGSRIPIVLLAAAVIPLAGGGGCGERAKVERPITVKVAILPEYSLPVMMDRYAPLIARMQEAAGPRYHIEWVSCPSPETFMATVENERPALGIQDAFHTALLQKLQDAYPVLQAVDRDGHATIRGAMIVREGSEGFRPGDRIALPSRRSFLFVSQTDVKSQDRIPLMADAGVVALRWQDEVADEVREGRVPAGLINEDAVGPGIRVIALTPPMPSMCVVAFPRTERALASILSSSLARMTPDDPADRPALEKLGIGGFIPVDRAGAARIRSLAERYSTPY